MKTSLSFFAAFALLAQALHSMAQGTAFTYQGQLSETAGPANGIYDLRFTIHDLVGGESPISGPITNLNTSVSNGLFSVKLDFGGGVFNGSARWMEIAVRTNGLETFTTLAPLQSLTPAPYAIMANSASNLLGTLPATQVAGALSLAQLPGEVVTNNQTEVNLNGSFAGNAIGLTNLLVDSLVRVTTNSSLVAWGANNSGQGSIPVGLNDVEAVATGFEHNVVLKKDGTVLAWGDPQTTNVPPDLNNVIAVAAGLDHSVAVRANGTVVAWGQNTFQQTNIPPSWTNIVAVAAGGEFNVALRNDGTVVARGRNQAGQTNVPPGLSDVAAVGAGFVHSVALRSNGIVVAWGGNDFGQTNVPSNLTNVVAIASGWTHIMALKADGRVVSWGLNDSGKTNVPAGLSNVIAMAAGMSHSLAARSDGKVFTWGANNSGQTNVPFGLEGVKALGIGPAANHAVAIRDHLYSPVAWLGANNTFEGLNTFNGGVQVNGVVQSQSAVIGGTVTAATFTGGNFSGNGSGLTNLNVNAANITSGTLADARLSGNVALLNSSPAFSGQVTAGAGVRLNDNNIWLRSSGNVNGLGWYGTGNLFSGVAVNGPVLFGSSGGALGQVSGRGETIALQWNASDDVGIGRSSATNRLEVQGAASKTTSGNWLANSDARIKTDVRPVSGALEKLARVRLVGFRYTDEYRARHSCIEDREHLNVIAQEFQEVFPDYVQSSGETLDNGSEILQVDTYPLTIYSAAAIQELNQKMEEQLALKNAEIDELKRSVAELKELILRTHR